LVDSIGLSITRLAVPTAPTGGTGATTHLIGPGQTYATFSALVAAVNLTPGDIIDGGGNTFRETWTPDASGTEGNPITLRNAYLLGSSDWSVSAGKTWAIGNNGGTGGDVYYSSASTAVKVLASGSPLAAKEKADISIVGTEMVTDWDMEAVGVTAWSTSNVTLAKDADAYSGTQSLKCTATVNAGTVRANPKQNVTAGKVYKFSTKAKVDDADSRYRFYGFLGAQVFIFAGGYSAWKNNTAYEELVTYFVVPSTGELTLYCQIDQNTDVVFLDEYSLVELTDVTAGKWFYDTVGQNVWYKLGTGESIATLPIEIGQRDYGVDNSSKNYIDTRLLDIKFCNIYGINKTLSNNCVSSLCNISGCGSEGSGGLIYTRRGDGNIISGLTGHDTFSRGVVIDGDTDFDLKLCELTDVWEYPIDVNTNVSVPSGYVRNNILDGFNSDGIAVHGVVAVANTLFIQDNDISGNLHALEDAIDLYQSSNVVVRRNKVHDNAGCGIKAGGNLSTANEVTFNVVHDNDGCGITNNGAVGNIYHNNTSVRNDGNFIAQNGSAPIASSNIFADATHITRAYDVEFPADDSGTIDHNVIWRSDELPLVKIDSTTYAVGDIAAFRAATTYGDNDMWADPLFTDSANNDFSLQSTSPCISSGIDAFVSSTDPLHDAARIKIYDGSTELPDGPFLDGVDIGAFAHVIWEKYFLSLLGPDGAKYWPSAPELIAITGVDNAVYNADGTGKTFATPALALTALATVEDNIKLFVGAKGAVLYETDQSANLAKIQRAGY
jgi:hypothetical protein